MPYSHAILFDLVLRGLYDSVGLWNKCNRAYDKFMGNNNGTSAHIPKNPQLVVLDEGSAVDSASRKAAIADTDMVDVLCLDEPSAGLDPLTSARLDDLIRRLKTDLGTAIVLVTHELESLFAVADRLLFLDVDAHTATALGPPAELRDHGPAAVREFLTRGAYDPAREAA